MKNEKNKQLRSYKLSSVSRKQMDWLRKHLGLPSDTAVIEHSVADLFSRKKAEFEGYLVPHGEDFFLYIGSVKVANVSSGLVSALPKEYLDRPVGERGSLLSALILTCAKRGRGRGTIQLDKEALASIYRSAFYKEELGKK